MFSVAFAAISLFSTSCQKRDLNSIAGGSNEKELIHQKMQIVNWVLIQLTQLMVYSQLRVIKL